MPDKRPNTGFFIVLTRWPGNNIGGVAFRGMPRNNKSPAGKIMPRKEKVVTLPARFMLVLALIGLLFTRAESGETFGVCVMATRHAYFQDMLDQIQSDADAAGVNIVAGDADFNLQRQIAIVEGYIARRVSLIMVAPCDSRGIVPTLEKARAAGIPVMTVDVAADWQHSISHCASDNRAGGRLAGGLLLDELAHRDTLRNGTVLVFDHVGVTSTFQRVGGFGDVMRFRGKQYRVEERDAAGQTPNALELTRKAIAEYGDRLVAIFGSNDGMTLGALQAVKEAGKLQAISIVGYDFVAESKDAVDKGELSSIVIQFPRKIGQAAFRIAHDYITGRSTNPPKEVLVEVGYYSVDGFFDQRFNPIDL